MIKVWRPADAATCILAVLSLTGAHAQGARPSVGDIIFLPAEMGAGHRVGTRKAGHLCLPAGPLFWRDVEPGLSASGIAAARGFGIDQPAIEFASRTEPAFKISGLIVEAAINACLAETGLKRALGGRKVTKVTGFVSIRWRKFDTRLGEVVWQEVHQQIIDSAEEGADVPSVLTAAIEASAGTVAGRAGQR